MAEAGLTILKHRPSGALGRYVESFWYVPPCAPPHGDSGMQVLPSGRAEIVIALGDAPQTCWRDGHRGDSFHGATVRLAGERPATSSMRSGEGAFGITFRPLGLRQFCDLAVCDLPREVVSANELWAGAADGLWQRAAEPAAASVRFARVESWLLAHLRAPHRANEQMQRAVERLATPFTGATVDGVAREVGLSARRLQELFRQDLGLAPKTFARIGRLGAAMRMAGRFGPTRWADVAAACRYSDQAHMVRDFKALAGMAPGVYLSRRTTGHAHCLPWQPPPQAPLLQRGQVGQQVGERALVG